MSDRGESAEPADAPADAPLDLKNPWLAGVLAWAVPGAGHLYQGRYGKAAVYFVCVLGLFLYGWHYSYYRAVYWRYDATQITYYYFAQVGAGLIAVPPAVMIDPTDPDWAKGLDEDHFRGLQINIGVIYTMVAGLLNFLAVYDAVCGLGGQAWMTGTGPDLFAQLGERAARLSVTEEDGHSAVAAA